MRAEVRAGSKGVELAILYWRRRTVQSLIRAIERYELARARAFRSRSGGYNGSSLKGGTYAE